MWIEECHSQSGQYTKKDPYHYQHHMNPSSMLMSFFLGKMIVSKEPLNGPLKVMVIVLCRHTSPGHYSWHWGTWGADIRWGGQEGADHWPLYRVSHSNRHRVTQGDLVMRLWRHLYTLWSPQSRDVMWTQHNRSQEALQLQETDQTREKELKRKLIMWKPKTRWRLSNDWLQKACKKGVTKERAFKR